MHFNLPPGTLVVNLVGGFIIGMALAFLSGSLTLIPPGSFLLPPAYVAV
jgi:CrcB protein